MSVFDLYPNCSIPQIIGKILDEHADRYPEPPLNLCEDDVEKMNWLHCARTDKFWRMYAGSSSDLVSYREGVVEIEIHTSQANIDNEGGERRRLRNQIDSWAKEKLLKQAHSYIAHLIVREKAVGANWSANELDPVAIVEKAKEICAPSVDVKVAEWRGQYKEWNDRFSELEKQSIRSCQDT